MKITTILASAALLLGGALAAAAQTQTAPPTNPIAAETTARLFQPVPGKAVIYLLRNRGDIWTFDVKVLLDGKDMGATSPSSYLRWEVPPGRHVIVSGTVPPAVIELKTEAGGMYYVWQDINVGFLRAFSRLEQVDQVTAKFTLDAASLRNP